MAIQKLCDEPGCSKGKIALFTSNEKCPKCNGTGYLYESENSEDTATQMYKSGIDWENGYDHEF